MIETPMKKNKLSDKAKKEIIEDSFRKIMQTLGLDLDDDSLQETPKRVSKMYVEEIFKGLKDENFPKITTVENKFEYDQMLIETGIEVKSVCEHHFVPIIGKATVAYIPSEKVLGLSKFNRVVDYYSRRPQVQERLTQQIQAKLVELLETENVAVTIDAIHYCVHMRGIEHTNCTTRTTALSGVFKDDAMVRAEFFRGVK